VFGRKHGWLAAVISIIGALTANAQNTESGQLDASPTLFTIMAALNAAGYDADLSSSMNSPLRNRVRAELAKEEIPSLAKIKATRRNSRNTFLSACSPLCRRRLRLKRATWTCRPRCAA
jgi:hypothetical protein